MTKKDLIRILVKILGVIFLLQSVPTLISQISLMSIFDEASVLLLIIFAGIITIALSCWLIFSPDSIIQIFKLDKGFDDDQIKLNDLKVSKLIDVAVLIIGGLFLVESVAPLFMEIAKAIYGSVAANESILPYWGYLDKTLLYTHIINLAIGIIIVSNYHKISLYLGKKDKNNNTI